MSLIDWTRGAGRPSPPRPDGVDVVIPVYGAAADLAQCLASVAEHTDLARHHLVLVIDGPQDDDTESVLTTFGAFAPDGTTVLRNESRRGFVESVNRGMSHSTRDVVLLNSDTVVTPRWMEKLIDASISSGDVGTVTPLSNHATLCSVPRGFVENLLPTGFDASSFGSLVERVSTRSYPRMPTAVGVCMYIRRALLEEIGLFDAARFGLGYGEENDFCMRALAKGWLHLCDDATFIQHAGNRSFGATRAARKREAARTLDRLHPEYTPAIAKFMKEDPLAPVRERIDAALRRVNRRAASRAPHRVMHLVHGWPPFSQAGAELYAWWLAKRQTTWREVSVFARVGDPTREQGEALELYDGGTRVRLVTNNFVQRDPLARNALSDRAFEREFARFLDEESPDLLHVHHLAGHSFSLASIANKRGIPIVYQMQDWWSMCGRVNLSLPDGTRCTGPSIAKCAGCATMTRVPPAPLWNRLLHVARRRSARRALATADAFVMGSEAIRRDYEREHLFPRGTPVHVLPYGVEVEASEVKRGGRERQKPLRFGFVGSILPHKGLHIAVAAFQGIDPTEATLHAFGNFDTSPDYTNMLREAGGASLVLEGTFAEYEKAAIFDSLDVLLVPSIGLESFGLAARESMARGVPVIATRDGALTEMFEDGSCGAFFPSGDAGALHDIILRIVRDPELLDRWAANIPPVKTVDRHAEEVEQVYKEVMAAKR